MTTKSRSDDAAGLVSRAKYLFVAAIGRRSRQSVFPARGNSGQRRLKKSPDDAGAYVLVDSIPFGEAAYFYLFLWIDEYGINPASATAM